jgi:hypothetical protein
LKQNRNTGVDYLFPEWQIYTEGPNSYLSMAFLPALKADFMGIAPPLINLEFVSGVPSVIDDYFNRFSSIFQ